MDATGLLAKRGEAKSMFRCTPCPRLFDKLLIDRERRANVANLSFSTYDSDQQRTFAAASAWAK
jgi:hypothetical protein